MLPQRELGEEDRERVRMRSQEAAEKSHVRKAVLLDGSNRRQPRKAPLAVITKLTAPSGALSHIFHLTHVVSMGLSYIKFSGVLHAFTVVQAEISKHASNRIPTNNTSSHDCMFHILIQACRPYDIIHECIGPYQILSMAL